MAVHASRSRWRFGLCAAVLVLGTFQQSFVAPRASRRPAARTRLAAMRPADAEWLEEIKKGDDVYLLPSGLMYKVLSKGDPKGAKPKEDEACVVRYTGKFRDGTTFEQTTGELIPGKVIAGWREALLRMRPGDKWELFIPSDLAYGDVGTDAIPPGAALKFRVQLKEVIPKGPLDFVLGLIPDFDLT
mmetsp:Transcript_69278/g.122603  ORF Transcript_69278/g.122603 Transcript_69278/m.122603 type:complete len:187 (-) Transcript_69278:168-728(-)|eukprot:CAMPEP_0197655892 /NCGR_PEP_ID=MMETSP1338-20131121/39736_1 /TAXON_ID=43686 ORGANISM="Pelagodinium beii, Strain RCC1491" /NCGR_SAMPLE_ID=MMETSP1338 /ASSEMBLY_ACC=CAM_ASM_000754 /LENGTH=186 /DNA_ID=CAMNT_0043231633 /DNA_START=78 /DNA_END=638 /DNA_ORIENTATION=+